MPMFGYLFVCKNLHELMELNYTVVELIFNDAQIRVHIYSYIFNIVCIYFRYNLPMF